MQLKKCLCIVAPPAASAFMLEHTHKHDLLGNGLVQYNIRPDYFASCGFVPMSGKYIIFDSASRISLAF